MLSARSCSYSFYLFFLLLAFVLVALQAVTVLSIGISSVLFSLLLILLLRIKKKQSRLSIYLCFNRDAWYLVEGEKVRPVVILGSSVLTRLLSIVFVRDGDGLCYRLFFCGFMQKRHYRSLLALINIYSVS